MSESRMSPESAETTALAAAIRAGDEEVFERLATGHRRELLVHCYRMLGSLDQAEDAVQEALLRAWRYRGSLQEGAPLRAWLYRVATNVCLDAIARDERRSALAGRSAEGGAPPAIEEVACGAQQLAPARSRDARAQAARAPAAVAPRQGSERRRARTAEPVHRGR